jgi:hypothetical protein
MKVYIHTDIHRVEWDSLTLREAYSRENPESAICVQNLDDSRDVAIRITYRISLRSSSLWEPRHPLLKVVRYSVGKSCRLRHTLFCSDRLCQDW